MNETINLLMNRHSVRAYVPDSVSGEEKDTILKAAFRAPTAGNMMLYSIIDITDQSLKDRLAETCDHQPFIAKAPLVLLFLADYQRWHDYFIHSGAKDVCRREGKAISHTRRRRSYSGVLRRLDRRADRGDRC